MAFIGIVTFTACVENIFGNYIPNHKTLLAVLSVVILVILVSILYESIKAWIKDWNKYSSNPAEPKQAM